MFFISLLSTTLWLRSSSAELSQFQPCPLLGPYLPPPRLDATSPTLQAATKNFTAAFDQYIAAADGKYGPISPNTTSFSVVIFAGSTYIPKDGDEAPFLFEYHHAATAVENGPLNANSIFAIGDLTQIFTALAVLLEMGDDAWSRSIVEYIPELKMASGNASQIDTVQWEDVTLGALASHLGGIARLSDACHIDEVCPRDAFLRKLIAEHPVELPDSTPVFSHAAFQLLALAVEKQCGKSLTDVLNERIIRPLRLRGTGFLNANASPFGAGLANTSLEGEPASLGLTSSITDLAALGQALLRTDLLEADQLRHWLKPVSSTSNLRNAVGRPWEVYHYGQTAIDPIIDVYTKSGTVGRYSSYFGLVPSVNVGFAILAVDFEQEAPDLNAYADILLAALEGVAALGYMQADVNIAGTYKAPLNGELKLKLTESDPGIAVTTFSTNGTDWLKSIAELAGIEKPEYLDLRLYPTGLQEELDNDGKRQVFQGVIQDKSALVDAGTPTCISWQTVGEVKVHGVPADRFILRFDGDGVVEEVMWQAGSLTFER